ncbi:hypothetical protein DB347_07275 [Opitutaceae bacterium EW11]|nr:hypothetical protein DB347_07275 [Opitutaceae bacterium EW11]
MKTIPLFWAPLALASALILAPATHGAANIVNQTWQLRTGDDAQWASPAYPVNHWRDYNLGISPESHALEGSTFWLRQTFRVPDRWDGKPLRCELRLSADDARLYLNGEQLPLKRDAEQSASFTLPPERLRRGAEENHLALRIRGPHYSGGVGTDFLRIRPENGPAPSVALSLGFPAHDHVFSKRDGIGFSLTAVLAEAESSAGTLRLCVENEFHKQVCVQQREIALSGARAPIEFSLPSLPSGFYRVVASYSAPEIESQEVQWFAVAPTELHCRETAPADLADFWKRAKAELAAVAPEFSVTLDETRSTATHRVYTASMKSVEGVTLRSWYVVPNRPGKFPAVLHVPGYGGTFKPEWFTNDDDIVHLGLEVRGHGRSADVINPGFGTPGYVGYKVLEPEHYIYRGAYLDCLRALDFLCSRQEIDSTRIAVEGGSQGGGLAIATAALADGRLKCCATAVPFLGDFLHHLEIRSVYIPEFEETFKAMGRGTFSDVAVTMSYIDTVNLAPWIRCPVLMGSGLFDDDCPSHINFAVYNRLTVPKEYHVYPDRPHFLGPEWGTDSRAWLRRQFGLPEVK